VRSGVSDFFVGSDNDRAGGARTAFSLNLQDLSSAPRFYALE
jgi:hypothetical protein